MSSRPRSHFACLRSRTTGNALLVAIILFIIYTLYNPGIDQEKVTISIRKDQRSQHESRLMAQAEARRLDYKYLPGLVAQGRPDSVTRHGHSQGGEATTSNLTAAIVLGRLRDEPDRVAWVFDELLNIKDKQIYIVDDPNTELPHLMKNHGREAAVYLTYIIDNYDQLNDITFFWHTDKKVWHNNLLLKWDSAKSINRMDRENIIRQGYVPSRCDHWPGCPAWIKFNPSKAEHRLDPHRLEEMFSPDLFKEMFPDAHSYPPYFAGTCCSQFAVSRETIRSNPIELYKRLLNWILEYQDDDRSGMVFEYIWPYIFLGRGILCPSMQECYCRTYNFCIQDQKDIEQLEYWNALRTRREEVKWQVNFAMDAISAKKEEMKRKGAPAAQLSEVVDALQPEVDRLTSELNRLIESTWMAREKIIHHWKLGVPPVGW